MKNIILRYSVTIILVFPMLVASGQEYIGIYSTQNNTFKETPGPANSVNGVAMVKSSARTNPDAGPLTVSASYSNHEYPQITGLGPAHFPLMFGGASNFSKTLGEEVLLVTLNNVGTPIDAYYKSSDGLSDPVSRFANNGFEQYVSVEQFQDDTGPNTPTLGSYYMGDITYTFSRLVENPVLHVTGLGGIFSSSEFGTVIFSVRYKLKSGASGLTKLAGTTRLDVINDEISNNFSQADLDAVGSTAQGINGDDAGTGSILVSGVVTSVTFEVYMDGKTPLSNGISNNWTSVPADGAGNDRYSGDRFNTSWSFLPTSILPITLSEFASIQSEGCEVVLNWKSELEESASHYEVEVSSDGRSFERLGTLKTEGSGSAYNYTLNGKNGYKYARLKLVDLNGFSSYSEIIKVKSNCQESAGILNVFPNPVQMDTKLSLNYFAGQDESTFSMYDLQGKLVSKQSFATNSNDVNSLQLDIAGLEAGLYMIVSPEGDSKRFIVTR